MDLESIMLSEISQSDRDKYHTHDFSLSYGNSNEQTELTSKTERENRMTANWGVWG